MTKPRPELTVVCAWCGKHLRGPREHTDATLSHGICEDCLGAELRAIDEGDDEAWSAWRETGGEAGGA